MSALRSIVAAGLVVLSHVLVVVPAGAADPVAARVLMLPEIQELPDPFLRADGTRIASREDWPAQRRGLLELVIK